MSNFRRRLIQTSEESMYAKFVITYPGTHGAMEWADSIGFCLSFGQVTQTGTIYFCSTCKNEYVKLKVKITNKETKAIFREYNHIFKKGDYIGFRIRIDGKSSGQDRVELNNNASGIYIIAYDSMEEGLYDVEILVNSNSPIIPNAVATAPKALEIINYEQTASSKATSPANLICLHSVEKLMPDASKTTNGRGFLMNMNYNL